MKKIFIALSLTIFGFSPPTIAFAQSETPAPAQMRVAVISQELALAKSKVGAYVADQLLVIDKQIDTEFEPELAPLRTQAQQLNAEMSALAPETLRTRTDLQRRGQTIRQSLAELGDWKQRQMEATRKQALEPVLSAYETAINAVITERNIQILLPGEATMFRTANADITEAVVAKIDGILTTSPVNRVRVPRVAPPQTQQGQAPR